MYTPVLIDNENSALFLPDMELDGADFWLGMVEAETGEAAGILGADYIQEDGVLSLSIGYIRVPEDETQRAVKAALIEYLLYLAYELGCASVYDAEMIAENGDDSAEALLSDLGFFEDEKTLPLYSFNLNDLNVRKTKSDCGFLMLSEISDQQWDGFVRRSDDYSFSVMDIEDYDPALSLFLCGDDRDLEAGILFREREDVLFVEVIAPYGSDEEALINDMIYWGMDRAKKKFGASKDIQLYLPNDRTYRDVLMKVTGDKAKITGRLVNFVYDVPV